ncbi:hypothetical protein PIROE2DRAFT_7669 [Piromyces sp. E2]|nr:hypothetical protein PIROE2DRAFT_7669 [Piromyces sp. E2]|eukprot:OUM65368.1 hypothetical protein PIROE2DRAFT_7669 [Piromyces sp. E2]
MALCVITGGAGGMGIEIAKIMGKTQKLILVDCSNEKLERAKSELKKLGIDSEIFVVDVCNRESIKDLVKFSKEKGDIKLVVHTAGISPGMADAERIFEVNALFNGTTCLKEAFKQIISSLPENYAPSAGYNISKNFVRWYTQQMAIKYSGKGIRVVSISPGVIDTPILEKSKIMSEALAKMSPLGRMGKPEEIAKIVEFLARDECSIVVGNDLLCDGGMINAIRAFNDQQNLTDNMIKMLQNYLGVNEINNC